MGSGKRVWEERRSGNRSSEQVKSLLYLEVLVVET